MAVKKQAKKPLARKRAPKGVPPAKAQTFALSPGGSYTFSLFGGPGGVLQEPWTGAWQGLPAPEDATRPATNQASALAFSAVYCAVTGISSDVGKLPICLKRESDSGIWEEMTASPFLPVLRRPNRYQNPIQFLEAWMLSKLLRGNAYIALERDDRGGEASGVVRAMHVLNPCRVTPLISDGGEVFYQLTRDELPNIKEDLIAPASEIIHDRMDCLWHPLIGVTPLVACAASGGLGATILQNSQMFFANRSMPGGMLSSPGRISDDTAARMKEAFEKLAGGLNIGRLFVAGDGLKFEPFSLTADASQLVDQLRLTREDVACAFHYPIYKLDSSKLPPYSGNNMEQLGLLYLSDCLQRHIESIERLLEDGLSLPARQHIELDTTNLKRMDTVSLYTSNNEAVRGGWMAPNEARNRANYGPVEGGETPYMQQQNFPLANLANQRIQQPPAPAVKSALPEPVEPGLDLVRSLEQRLAALEARPAGIRYREVYRASESYSCGDAVTHDGGLWVCIKDTGAVPGKSTDWRLAVKRGTA